MSRFKEVRSSLFALAIGGCAVFYAWDLWNGFAQLESGQRESLKVWAPIAALYGAGGVWAPIAKWGGTAFFALSGAFYAWISGILPWFGGREAEPAASGAPAGLAPSTGPVDDSGYDLTLDVEVTREQVAREEVIAFAGPNGDVRLKLDRRYRTGRLRLAGEGLQRKGDLYVMLTVRDA